MKPLHTLFLVLSLACAQLCFAHLMPAQQGSINIQGKSAFVAVALPASGLTIGDANRDGRLSTQEASIYQQAIAEQVSARLQLWDGDTQGNIDFIQINAESDASHSGQIANSEDMGTWSFLALIKISFPKEPQALHLRSTFFGTRPDQMQLTMKAIRGDETEVVMLTPQHAQHHFFRSSGQVLGDYIVIGVQHILSGWDHLAFLLTILCIINNWRQGLLLTGAFTVAHSLSLIAALLELVHFNPRWIESAIAISIIIMACLNLLIQRWPGKQKTRWRLFVVFSFGLLHGLGFAASLSAIGLNTQYRVWSLLGFNAGIEIGQLFFLSSLSLFYMATQRYLPGFFHASFKTQWRDRFLIPSTNLLALGVGVYFLLY